MRRLRSEDGIALVSAIIVLMILLGLGAGLLLFTDAQSRSATYDQSSEKAYALAEAALNAQITQLSSHWPASGSPAVCDPTTGATLGCPNPTTLQPNLPTGGSPTCPANTPKDAWGSSLSTPWTTYVRDDGSGTDQVFNSSVNQTQPAYDASGPSGNPDGAVWVRAVGVAGCRTAVVVAKVSAQFVQINLPQKAVDANGFGTANNGNKIIIDTLGTYAQPSVAVANPSGTAGDMSMRCTSLTNAQCKSYQAAQKNQIGQVVQDTTNAAPTASPTLTQSQLNAMRQEAINKNTYWPTGSCPTSASQLAGTPTFIEGPCTMAFKANGTVNSSASPGFLVINNGSLSLDGTLTYYGVVYAANAQGASGTPCKGNDVIVVAGNAEVQGAILVDGTGTVCFGSSGNGNNTTTNFVYDVRGFSLAVGWGGAVGTPNSFRQLPQGQ